MKKSIKKSIIALTLVFAMSVGMFASANSNASDLGSSWRIFTDQYDRGEQRTEADISDAIGTLKSWWYLYDGDNGNSQIAYADIVDSGTRVAGPGVQFGIRSEYFWYTVSCDKSLSYTTSPVKLDTVKFGAFVLTAPTVKFYRYSNFIYEDKSYCMVRQASKLAKVGEITNRTVKIYADGNYVTEVTRTFPNRSDDTTMVASDVYVTALYGPYYTWSSKVESGYYRIDLKSHYSVTASVANGKGSASVAASIVDHKGSTTATFTASSGYYIDYVTDNGTKFDVTNASSYTYTVSEVTSSRNIVATTIPINYSISYDLGGGSVSGNPSSYNIETSAFTLKNPTKSGYTFAGWTGSNGSTAQTTVTIAKGSTGNRTYTANWSRDTYTIDYNLDGGSVSTANPTSYNVETATFTLNNPTKTGYTFAGWTGTGLSSASTSVSVAKGSTGNRSYTANWTPVTYTVTYNGNGATSGSTASQTFTWGESKALSANGFKKEFTVTYNANGGTADKANEIAASTFNGWDSQSEIALAGVPYLYSTFEAPEATNVPVPTAISVLFTDKQVVSNLTDVNNATISLIANWTPGYVTHPNATRTGYTFDGWFDGNTNVGGGGDAYTPSTNKTLIAEWSTIEYTIAYDLAGGSVSTANPTSYTVESSAITLNNPKKDGYTFTGWTGTGLSSASTSVSVAKGSTGNRSYTANWSVETYEITYDYNGGTDPGNTTSFTVESGEIKLKPPTKTGYIFDGWTGSNGSTPQKDVTISANSVGEKTYTANWTAESYTITYNLDGGSASGNPTSYTIESADISLKTPTKTGYVFTGWTGSNGATAQTSVTIPTGSMGNKTYTATWLQAEYTVTWKNDDGTVLKTEKVKYNETPTYAGETPTKASTAQYEYTFSGWSPEIVPATEDATYTAQYTEKTRKYAITFKNDDGTVLETKDTEYGKTPNYTGEVPTKAPTESEVFTFAGWSPALGTVAGEAEYTATYTSAPRKYTVRWMNGETELATEEYEYNAMPSYKGEEPTKEKDNTYSYEFAGWSPEPSKVITDATYSAIFTPTELPPAADLIIETSGCKAEQSFVFSVKSNEDSTFAPLEVSIVGNGKVVIKDIPTGAYTVTEENSWTWRYSDEYEKTVTVIAGEENKVTFKDINEPTIKKWLSGLAALFK